MYLRRVERGEKSISFTECSRSRSRKIHTDSTLEVVLSSPFSLSLSLSLLAQYLLWFCSPLPLLLLLHEGSQAPSRRTGSDRILVVEASRISGCQAAHARWFPGLPTPHSTLHSPPPSSPGVDLSEKTQTANSNRHKTHRDVDPRVVFTHRHRHRHKQGRAKARQGRAEQSGGIWSITYLPT